MDRCKADYDAKGVKLVQEVVGILEKWDKASGKPNPQIRNTSLGLGSIAMEELGLDPLGVTAALLYPYMLAERYPGEEALLELPDRIVSIMDELGKISDLDTTGKDHHAENMRNLVLSLANDFRVIMIRIAAQLQRMRMARNKQDAGSVQLAIESRSIYSPLAHRLGLYAIMSEMEDVAMSILEQKQYQTIAAQLKATKKGREEFIANFVGPLKEKLEEEQLTCEVFGRPKSISSIWRKMRKQNVEFQEVYDKFAIRIIIHSKPKKEKSDCWKAYSVVTDIYQPNPNRMRDWISVPKSNGYESLHTTVVVPGGDWVEVQIRTSRMNEIAEKGLAAHWKYKGIKGQAGIDDWLGRVREALDQSDSESSINLIDDLKISQFSNEIFVFTPKGDLRKLSEGATILDFAYDIHTDVGGKCTGARVNGKNVPIRYKLSNGDRVEILTSPRQRPKVDWLNYVSSGKAKTKIRQTLKEVKLKEAENGKEILRRRFKNWKIDYNDANVRKIIQHFKYKDSIDLHYDISTGKVDPLTIKEVFVEKEAPVEGPKTTPIEEEQVDRLIQTALQESNDFLVIDEKIANIDYKLARCCNPIHGDNVFGFVTRTAGISIHRLNCPNAHDLMTRYGYRVVKAQWTQATEDTRFSVTITITGVDDLGIVSNITDVISKDLQVNMRSIAIDSRDGLFEGTIGLFVKDAQHLEALNRKLKKVKGVNSVRRIQ